ncbi:MAG: hypothetical protein KF901_22895 [Myxococcales bacterium]|nr:hypothetical protein [Myxococcales bacterium]
MTRIDVRISSTHEFVADVEAVDTAGQTSRLRVTGQALLTCKARDDLGRVVFDPTYVRNSSCRVLDLEVATSL